MPLLRSFASFLHDERLAAGQQNAHGKAVAASWYRCAVDILIKYHVVKVGIAAFATTLYGFFYDTIARPIDHARVFILFGLAVFILDNLMHHFFNVDNPQQHFGKFRPSIFLSFTSHCRFLPVKGRRFRYPLLYVGFPATLKGQFCGSLFSVLPSTTKDEAEPKKSRFTWLTINPALYLRPELPFEDKLRGSMIHEGLDPNDYPHIYVVTTPQFLGYSFNPVTYYYLYDDNERFQGCALEVNNTFGEKTVYFVMENDANSEKPRPGYHLANKAAKKFHISPFNKRAGSYLFQVRDPLSEGEVSRQDINMTVINEKGNKVMVARAYSLRKPFDLLTGSRWFALWIALFYGPINFLALPRTFFQAWKMNKKNPPVHERPEPRGISGKRRATPAELRMQTLFLQYLAACVERWPAPLQVRLTIPQWQVAAPPDAMLFESRNIAAGAPIMELSLEIINHRFFHGLLNAPTVTNYLQHYYVNQDEEHRPIATNDIFLLASVLEDKWVCPRSALSYLTSIFLAILRIGSADNQLDSFFLNTNEKLAYLYAVFEARIINGLYLHEASFWDLFQDVILYSILTVAAVFLGSWLFFP